MATALSSSRPRKSHQAFQSSLRSLLPPQGSWSPSSSDSYVRFRDHLVNFDLLYRNRHVSRMVRNWWYYLGRQWIQQDQARLHQAAQGFVWRDIRRVQGVSSRPRPVTNKTAVQVDNEVARLSRKEFVPAIWTDSSDPTVLTGARTAKQVLDYKLEQLLWPELRDYSNLCMAVQGLSTFRVGWDISLTNTIKMGIPGAFKCSACDQPLASLDISPQKLQGSRILNSDTISSVPFPIREQDPEMGEVEIEEEERARFKDCPSCQARGTLEEYEIPDDDLDTYDRFKRPLGMTIPKGDTSLEVCHGSELFPFNGGLCDPRQVRILGRAVPREIEWLEERYPEFCDQFYPDPPDELMKVHPILGESDYLTRYNPGADQGIFDHHMMTYEFRIEPYMDFGGDEDSYDEELEGGGYYPNQGRYLFMAGDTCCEDGDLFVSYQDYKNRTRMVPRVSFPTARHRIRPGEFWANSLVDDLISPQNRINHRDSQMIQALDLFASPQVLAHREAHLTGPEWFTAGAGRILYYDIYPGQPSVKPEIFQAGSLPADTWREREQNATDFQEIGGGADVELGNIPKGLKTTSGLVVSGDNAGQRRQPRERAQKRQYSAAFKHLLQLLVAFRTEKETYEVDAPGASVAKTHTFRGADLCEQVNVRITAEAGIEKDIYTREAAAEAKQEGVYDLTDPVARRRYLELRGLPEINETFKRQFDRAQKAAGSFLDKAILPVVDPYIKASRVWYAILGEVWLSDELADLQQTLGWDDVVWPKIAGWQKTLDELVVKDAAARKAYTGMTPQQAQQMYQQALQDQAVAIEATKAAMAATPPGQPPPQLPPPPPLPPEPVFLPPAYEERIWTVWMQSMGTPENRWDNEPLVPDESAEDPRKVQALNPDGISPLISLERLMRYRACIEAFRLHAEELDGKKAMGLPTIPAPGGDPMAALGAAATAPPGGRQTNTPTLPEPPPVLPGPAANAAAGGTVPQSAQV